MLRYNITIDALKYSCNCIYTTKKKPQANEGKGQRIDRGKEVIGRARKGQSVLIV
jgi:hypothetical protein